MFSVMTALHALVVNEASITTLVGERIYMNRIPRDVIESADTFHPPKMLVLRMAGGSGKADLLHTDDTTVDALCYGETDFDADNVRRAVWQLFVNLDRETHSQVLIHTINPTGGPIPSVEPDLVWPVIAQSFTVKANVKEVA